MPEKDAHILIVEDEVIVGMEISQMIGDMGYRVMGVKRSGEEAVSFVEEQTPDLVIMDIRLKGQMNGIDAAQIIYMHKGSKILFVTANSDMLLSNDKLPFFYGCLIKPVHSEDLESAISHLLTRHESPLNMSNA